MIPVRLFAAMVLLSRGKLVTANARLIAMMMIFAPWTQVSAVPKAVTSIARTRRLYPAFMTMVVAVPAATLLSIMTARTDAGTVSWKKTKIVTTGTL
jgi:hypothetical protein